jgi:hypothetical protein
LHCPVCFMEMWYWEIMLYIALALFTLAWPQANYQLPSWPFISSTSVSFHSVRASFRSKHCEPQCYWNKA